MASLRHRPGQQQGYPPNTTDLTKDQYLVYPVEANGSSSGSDNVTLNPDNDIGVTGIGNGTLRMRAHDEIRDALAGAANPCSTRASRWRAWCEASR